MPGLAAHSGMRETSPRSCQPRWRLGVCSRTAASPMSAAPNKPTYVPASRWVPAVPRPSPANSRTTILAASRLPARCRCPQTRRWPACLPACLLTPLQDQRSPACTQTTLALCASKLYLCPGLLLGTSAVGGTIAYLQVGLAAPPRQRRPARRPGRPPPGACSGEVPGGLPGRGLSSARPFTPHPSPLTTHHRPEAAPAHHPPALQTKSLSCLPPTAEDAVKFDLGYEGVDWPTFQHNYSSGSLAAVSSISGVPAADITATSSPYIMEPSAAAAAAAARSWDPTGGARKMLAAPAGLAVRTPPVSPPPPICSSLFPSPPSLLAWSHPAAVPVVSTLPAALSSSSSSSSSTAGQR